MSLYKIVVIFLIVSLQLKNTISHEVTTEKFGNDEAIHTIEEKISNKKNFSDSSGSGINNNNDDDDYKISGLLEMNENEMPIFVNKNYSYGSGSGDNQDNLGLDGGTNKNQDYFDTETEKNYSKTEEIHLPEKIDEKEINTSKSEISFLHFIYGDSYGLYIFIILCIILLTLLIFTCQIFTRIHSWTVIKISLLESQDNKSYVNLCPLNENGKVVVNSSSIDDKGDGEACVKLISFSPVTSEIHRTTAQLTIGGDESENFCEIVAKINVDEGKLDELIMLNTIKETDSLNSKTVELKNKLNIPNVKINIMQDMHLTRSRETLDSSEEINGTYINVEDNKNNSFTRDIIFQKNISCKIAKSEVTTTSVVETSISSSSFEREQKISPDIDTRSFNELNFEDPCDYKKNQLS